MALDFAMSLVDLERQDSEGRCFAGCPNVSLLPIWIENLELSTLSCRFRCGIYLYRIIAFIYPFTFVFTHDNLPSYVQP
jgi:hypothetical protein